MAIDEKHLRVQPVQVDPVDADGVNCFVIGSILCAIICVVFYLVGVPSWQMHSALAGLLIGGFGLAYCVLRKR